MTSGFEVSHTTSGARGMRAILHRQIEAAIAELPRHDPTDEEIHEARKRMKAARATLRLLRPVLGEQRYRAENRMQHASLKSMTDEGRHPVGGKTNKSLQRLIDKRRRKLRKRALQVGLPLYAEKPAHFAARLRRYLLEWT